MSTDPVDFVPRPGALRYKEGDIWKCVNPGDLWYSTVTFLAEEYYQDNEWKKIETE